jgi:shikimate kinase
MSAVPPHAPNRDQPSHIKAGLGQRSIVMIGLMGCGKTSVGRRTAAQLGLPFVDADEAIEKAAGKSIKEIFEDHGEAYFRDGERRVIARLLRSAPQPQVLPFGSRRNYQSSCGAS